MSGQLINTGKNRKNRGDDLDVLYLVFYKLSDDASCFFLPTKLEISPNFLTV